MGRVIDRIGTLGILGGGQLARMTAVAARRLGYASHVLDPGPECSARGAADQLLVAPLSSVEHALVLAKASDVVTLDTEHVPVDILEAVAGHTPMHPGARVLQVVQDRGVQKRWLARRGYPVGAFRIARDPRELAVAFRELPGRVYVKRTRGGYDGLGQRVYDEGAPPDRVIQELGSTELVVERAVPLRAELSILVARSVTGELAVYPAALNHHERGILAWSMCPAPLAPQLGNQARDLALCIATDLGVIGLLCVELFLTEDGELLVNELAPRPHNSFHHTEIGCATSQFEQLVRAVCGLPLGSVSVTRPAAICNLLSDLWAREDHTPQVRAALAVPGVTLQLYGKAAGRPGRKMGHLTAVGSTPEQALESVLRARHMLGEVTPSRLGARLMLDRAPGRATRRPRDAT